MKSEKAKQYLKNNREEVEINWETGETAWMIWPKDARKAVEIAEQEAEERIRRELTRWHDPKEEQPENNVCVLIKVADKFGNSAIYLGSREGNEYLTDGGFEFEIDCNDESSSEMKVIGWREMM